MGRKLNLSHLSEEECEKILHVLQKDFEVRQTEKERIGAIQNELKSEQNKTQVLSQQRNFNRNCCIRCCKVFGLIFNRRRQCYHCGYNVCKDCCDYSADTKNYVCHTCEKEKDLSKQSCSWYYNSVGHKFRRFGSAKVVRSLYKSSSYCKLRQVITQGGLNSNRLIIITNKDSNNNKHSDTELDQGYSGSGHSRSVHLSSGKRHVRPPLPDAFRPLGSEEEEQEEEQEEEDSDELPPPSPLVTARPPSATPITRRLGGPHPVTRAGSVDTLNLLPPSSSSSSTSKRHKTRTSDPSPSSSSSSSKPLRASDLGKSRTPDPGGARARWDDASRLGGRERVQKETKDNLYKHAFESARQAEEHKFKAKFNVLLTDLHQTLDRQSPHGLSDSFASTSYGEVMLSFRGRVKDLLVGFTQRLQLAYESFDSFDEHPEDPGQEVRQNVSRLLEDLLGESLDLTSDEAVSDLSSLSDDSGNDRHAFEDQIAQAVVSKILDNHRREVHNSLHDDRRSRHLSSPPHLLPDALNNGGDEYEGENDDDERRSPAANDARDTDISKDFEDLRNFVQETQSRTRLGSESGSCPGSDFADGGTVDVCGVLGSGDSGGGRRVGDSLDTGREDREWPPLPDFSQFDQIDFNSEEVDPDLVQMNLAVIPEETDEQLDEEVVEDPDTHWRENWIFKGQAPNPASASSATATTPDPKRRLRGDNHQPQIVMVPQPDEDLAPTVGNTEAHLLSDLSDNEELTDDESSSFYPGTSEELARVSRHHTPPSSSTDPLATEDPSVKKQAGPSSLQQQQQHAAVSVEDVSVGTEDLVGPIVEKTPKELKLLEDLVPAEGDDPRFLVAPESVKVQEGEPLKLSCRVGGTQPVDVFWYREGQGVEELEQGEEVEVVTEGERHHVTLYNLTRGQAGQYMCIALSDLGKAVKYFTVTVTDNKQELKKPEFLKELQDVEVLEGQSVKFRCKVKGYPQPRINWYKDGKLLRSNRSCRIEKYGNRDYILTMDSATMDDDAEYSVVASNVAGRVRSTAQVIVEPYAEGHPLLLKSRSQSMSTVYTDTESDRPGSLLMEDLVLRDSGGLGDRAGTAEDSLVDCLASKVSATRDDMRQEAENMLATADQLHALSHHLDDVERHLDDLDGHGSYRDCSANRPRSSHRSSYFPNIHDDAALAMIADERAMGETTRNIRKLTSNALSVLRAAEEIIQSERSQSDVSLTPSQQGSRSSPAPCLPLDSGTNKPVSLWSSMDQCSLTSQSDLSQSVSSGYGTLSMTSSAVDDTGNDDTITEASLSQLDQDEFALCLPPLDEPASAPYREEVSINLAPNTPTKTPSGGGGGGRASSSSSSSTLTDSSASSSTNSGKTVKSLKAVSPLNGDFSDILQSLPSASEKGAATGEEEEEENLVLNFGPKEINAAAYTRDYDVAQDAREREAAERKRWSVTLDPFVATAEVVNRQPSVEETEEKIYLTAGKVYQLEDRVKELQARVDADSCGVPTHTLSRLEDHVAKTAAGVARSEREVSSIERAVSTLQFSPRSSTRGSSSSLCSTPRESIDSGVSPFLQERPHPVHLVGHSQEGEVPESRTEFDADSGVELPSVHRLRAMFGGSAAARGKEDEWLLSESGFKRIHSITARSLTKDQMQTLREAGNSTVPDHHQSKATLHLQSSSPGRPEEHTPSSSSSSLSVSLSHSQQHHHKQPVAVKKRDSMPNVSPSGRYKDLDPSNQPVLIYPETEERVSSSCDGGDRHPVSTLTLTPVSAAAAASLPAVGEGEEEVGGSPLAPRIKSGCISARAAFWERRIMQGEATDLEVEEEFPEMVQSGHA
ncbi:uncharacterized protein LOC143292571 isoform X2 [Babylonia areolata]|uniref:uncharacterized protein LOC143292571 isoform X2 n=1 Tax=Babylonia areolata TaxID=304850 RepID=UPI003FD23930